VQSLRGETSQPMEDVLVNSIDIKEQ